DWRPRLQLVLGIIRAPPAWAPASVRRQPLLLGAGIALAEQFLAPCSLLFPLPGQHLEPLSASCQRGVGGFDKAVQAAQVTAQLGNLSLDLQLAGGPALPGPESATQLFEQGVDGLVRYGLDAQRLQSSGHQLTATVKIRLQLLQCLACLGQPFS